MIFLLENRAQDLMTLLIYHHPEKRKQTRIPKDKEGVSGKSQKTFLSPNGYPKPSPLQLHRMQLVQYIYVQITRQKLHSKCSTSKNKFQISKYQLTSTKLFASTSENTKTNSNHRITTTVSTAEPANQTLIQ